MKTLSILSQKGGATKTTLVIHLAVAAEQQGKKVAIIDLDPQASAAKWKDLRPGDTPAVITAQASRLNYFLDIAKNAGADLAIIDTAPHSDNIAVAAARSADFILIPTKCSILDLQTISSTVDIIQLIKTPAAIVLSSVPVRGMTESFAREALGALGVEISPYSIGDRAAFRNATNEGLTAQEYEPKGKAAQEIQNLYEWVSQKLEL